MLDWMFRWLARWFPDAYAANCPDCIAAFVDDEIEGCTCSEVLHTFTKTGIVVEHQPGCPLTEGDREGA